MNFTRYFLGCLVLLSFTTMAQTTANEVPHGKMQAVFEEIKTPYKYGLVLVPDSSLLIDCPTIFRKGNAWYMSYIIFNGRGYETWLSKSKDLLNWRKLGRLMSFGRDTSTWDADQKAGYVALVDTKWGGSYSLKQFNGKYWMSYYGGKETGYEAGLLSLGMAYTEKNPATAHEWNRLPQPILNPLDKDVRWWETKKQYKSTVIYDEKKSTGYSFLLYFNAHGDTVIDNTKTAVERIGMAASNDMIHWTRFGANPVLQHPEGITGDPWVQKIGSVYVMFYFGAFWSGKEGAFNRFACSYDLVHWTDWTGEDLIQPSEEYDNLYAHKSCVVKYKGIVYHFYCAVNKKQQRGIAVATSREMGKSKVHFIAK